MENNEFLDQGMYAMTADVEALSSEDKGYLESAAKWAKFLGIVGFVMTGFIIIAGIAMFAMSSFLGSASTGMGASNPFAALGPILGVVYLLFAAPYYFLSLYLYRFATKTQASLYASNQGQMTEAFKNLRGFFRLSGYLVIAILALYVLMIVFSGAIASMIMKQSMGN